MKENNKKKKLVLILSCIGIACIMAGVTYSLVSFVFQGHREHTIDLKGLSFSYEEGANGLSLTKLTPMSDAEGLASGNDYTFSVSATSRTAKEVPYHIYLTIDNENLLSSNYVRINITNTTTNKTVGPINASELVPKEKNDYYLIEDKFSFNGTTTNLTNNYKLTIWINEDYVKGNNYQVENNEQTTTIGGETFNFKINVATGEKPLMCDPMLQDVSNANVPSLASNMIPVCYNSEENVWMKADSNNINYGYKWYSYSEKKWANAVTVTEVDGSRSDLVDAAPGTPIPMDRINTMLVWIPRFSATGDTANYNGGTVDAPGAFNITFVDTNTAAHDAFDFGGAVSGFWMGKFENSSDTTCSPANNSAVGSGCNLTTIRPKILPNATSWRGAMVSTFFYDILAMTESENQYGFDKTKDTTLDTHMLKNNEWGAVAYLTQSIYGRCSSSTSCTEIGINNKSTYTTGYGAPAGSRYSVTNGTYETALGMDASTTGNIYGVYDMSGGAHEYVMGVYWDGTKYWSSDSTTTNYNSGFNGCLGSNCSSTLETGVAYPSDSKYYNLYTTSTNYNSAGLQHGMTETSGWYGDNAVFVNASNPWVYRGGNYSHSSYAGVFYFSYNKLGYANTDYGSRSAVVIN